MKNRVIALGFFDGVHLGHAALLKKTVARALEYGASPTVLTFRNHPGELTGKENIGLINTAEERTRLINCLFGIDDVVMWEFDTALMKMPWQDFIKDAVCRLNAVHFVVGYDHRFGYMGEGTPDKLSDFAKVLNVGVDIMPPVELDGEAVSSTRIRSFLRSGDIERANEFLGHPHCIMSRVQPGEQLGRTMGLPTVNQHFSKNVLVPAFGVYASKVHIEGNEYLSVTNIGVRPTVTDSDVPKAETHIMGYSGDLYGKEIYTELYGFIRGEKCFSSLDELKGQIEKDKKTAKNFFL